jgi:hypothetical protein
MYPNGAMKDFKNAVDREMTRYFSDSELEELHLHRRRVSGKHAMLQFRVTTRNYTSERGSEHALHGFGRRLRTLERVIRQVFEILSPEREDIPVHDEVVDATIAIQSFIVNVVGCLDNLAWVWVYENNLKAKNGTNLNPKSVGLWKSHVRVRNSLPKDFRDYLDSRDSWFDYIKGFRDSLAHRIPLYIPPYIVPSSNIDEHNRLEHEANTTADFEQHERARSEQRKLAVFRPWITHSIHEQAPWAIFHPQLLIDYDTIDELGNKMFDELDQARRAEHRSRPT